MKKRYILYRLRAWLPIMAPQLITSPAPYLLQFLTPWWDPILLRPSEWSFHSWRVHSEVCGIKRRLLHRWYREYGSQIGCMICLYMKVMFHTIIEIVAALLNGNNSMVTWESVDLPFEARTCTPRNINCNRWYRMNFKHILIGFANLLRPVVIERIHKHCFECRTNKLIPFVCLVTLCRHLPHQLSTNCVHHLSDRKIKGFFNPVIKWLHRIGCHLPITHAPAQYHKHCTIRNLTSLNIHVNRCEY